MIHHRRRLVSVSVAAACFVALVIGVARPALADPVVVRKLGDGGWKAEDCRSDGDLKKNDIVGPKSSHLGSPAKPPVADDDAVLASMIRFVDLKRGVPAGATMDGAVLLFAPPTGGVPTAGKVTLSTVNTDKGFTTGDWHKDFKATYRWYGVDNRPLFKIAVRSTKWGSGEGQSQFKHKPVRTGDGAFDMVLVLDLAETLGEWRETKLSPTEGKWHVFTQHGNTNIKKPDYNDVRTLDQWAADPVYGPLLFGATTKVVDVQFGIGSGDGGSGYVDWVETSLLNKGERIDFAGGEPLVTPRTPTTQPAATQPATTKPAENPATQPK